MYGGTHGGPLGAPWAHLGPLGPQARQYSVWLPCRSTCFHQNCLFLADLCDFWVNIFGFWTLAKKKKTKWMLDLSSPVRCPFALQGQNLSFFGPLGPLGPK